MQPDTDPPHLSLALSQDIADDWGSCKCELAGSDITTFYCSLEQQPIQPDLLSKVWEAGLGWNME